MFRATFNTTQMQRAFTVGLAKINLRVVDMTKDFALAARVVFARNNPVLTGRSSAGWNLNTLPSATQQGTAYRNPDSLQARINDSETEMINLSLGGSLWISNRTTDDGTPSGFFYPYVLEFGNSRIRPRGYVQRAYNEVRGGMR